LGEIFVRYLPLPPTVHGFTVTDSESNYNIYLNPADSYEGNQKTLVHELGHIQKGDFCSLECVGKIENF